MNRVELRLTDVAVTDIQEQADWYEQRWGGALARRWEDAITAALIRIEKNPHSSAKCCFRADELQERSTDAHRWISETPDLLSR
jgi:plasmid stabilization system protein ParE